MVPPMPQSQNILGKLEWLAPRVSVFFVQSSFDNNLYFFVLTMMSIMSGLNHFVDGESVHVP